LISKSYSNEKTHHYWLDNTFIIDYPPLIIADTVVDHISHWDQLTSLRSWGSGSGAPTFGQTFSYPANARLSSFTFELQKLDGVDQNYRAYVYQWDSTTSNITGTALYTSAIQQAPSSRITFTPVTIDSINVPIAANQQYVLFLTTSNVSQDGSGTYEFGYHPIPDTDGNAVTGSSNSIWSTLYGHFAFSITLFTGPSAADTQSSLQNTGPSLQGVFALEHSDMTDVLTYECNPCDKFCIAFGARFHRAYKSGFHSSNGLVTGAYRVNEHTRVGVWLDQYFAVNLKNSLSVNKSKPMVGLFGLWNQHRSGQGWEAKLAVGYGQKELTVARAVVGSSEPGSGSTKLITQGMTVDLINNILINDRWIASPFAGLRYTKIKANSYSERATDSVTAPLTYADLIQKTSTMLAGLKILGDIDTKASVYGSLGLELDVKNKDTKYVATGVSGLTSIETDGYSRWNVSTC
jgi:hypothetical protein